MRASIPSFALVLLLTLSSCGEDDDSSPSSGGAAGAGRGGTAGSAGAATGGTGGGSGAATGGAAGSGGSGGGQAGTGGQSGSGGQAGSGGGAAGSGGAVDGGGGQGGASGFALTSSAYTEGTMIPKKYECTSGGGQSVSPPLSWTAGPAGTQSYAIVMRDLDFNGFLHWVIWDIPGNLRALPENVQQVYQPSDPAGAKQAPFNGTVTGYYGPCSPSSVNTYELTIYAIPTATLAGLSQTSTKTQAADAIVAAATASAKLSGES